MSFDNLFTLQINRLNTVSQDTLSFPLIKYICASATFTETFIMTAFTKICLCLMINGKFSVFTIS